jgi:hypothetical protein
MHATQTIEAYACKCKIEAYANNASYRKGTSQNWQRSRGYRPDFFPGISMQFTKLGQSGLSVSRVTLGTGTFGKQTDEVEAMQVSECRSEQPFRRSL